MVPQLPAKGCSSVWVPLQSNLTAVDRAVNEAAWSCVACGRWQARSEDEQANGDGWVALEDDGVGWVMGRCDNTVMLRLFISLCVNALGNPWKSEMLQNCYKNRRGVLPYSRNSPLCVLPLP